MDTTRQQSAFIGRHLVHACVHASYSPRRGTLQWVCDAWLLADAQPDWDVVLQASEFSGVALPQYVALRYLATELRVPVPDAVLQHLGSLAARADACDRDAALFGARQGAPPIPGAANWQTRLTLARWHLLPSRAYLQESDSAGGAGSLWRYANRPLKYVANRLSRRFRLPRALSPEERLLFALAKSRQHRLINRWSARPNTLGHSRGIAWSASPRISMSCPCWQMHLERMSMCHRRFVDDCIWHRY